MSVSVRSRVARGAPFVAWSLLLALAACGGSAEVLAPPPFVVSAPPQDGGAPRPPDVVTPPPEAPRPPTWDASAADLGRTALYGSFPSDGVLRGSTLFVVDADQIEEQGARILAFDVSGPVPAPSAAYAVTTVRASDLRASDGSPADLANPIGFGFFLGDLAIVDDTLGFVVVNAGGSDSAPALSNLVVFDPSTGLLRQVVNLATTFVDALPLVDSAGGVAQGNAFLQAGAQALAYVASPAAGRLFVAMTNLLVGSPSFGAVKQRGTIQVFDVAPAETAPVRARPRPGLATETWLTRDYNPVALQVLTTDAPLADFSRERLLITVGGTTAYDAAWLLRPVTPASVEVHDVGSAFYRGRFELGLAGLAGTPPALGRDAAGNRVGFFASSVTGEVYLLWLDGLYPAAVDASRLAVLRGVGDGLPVTPSLAGTPGGNLGGLGLSPDGRTLLVTNFGDLYAQPWPMPGQLRALGLPADLVGVPGFVPTIRPGTDLYASEANRTLGRLLLRPNAQDLPDVFVLVSGALDPPWFLGASPASVGTLTTHGLLR